MLSTNDIKTKINKSPMVVQHNKLVQGSYRMTLQEKRLVLWLISQIRPGDKDFKKYTLRVSEFVKMLGIKSNHNIYRELQKVTKELLSRVVTIELPEERKLIQVSFFSSSVYKYGEGVVEFSFDPALKPYLLELTKHFTALSLTAVIGFSSVHAIRIYELLKQYETIGSRVLTINELKLYLGIGEKEYETYGAFKNRILKIAQREINNKSDICFLYEENKIGRKVGAIKCIISKNNTFQKSSLPCPSYTPAVEVEAATDVFCNDPLFQQLNKIWGISPSVIEKLFKNHSAEYIEKIVNDVKKRLIHKDINNAAAYLLKAIENGWQHKSSEDIVANINDGLIRDHIKNAPNDIWRSVLEELLNFFEENIYISWFAKINFINIDSGRGVVCLQAPTNFIKSYIEDHYVRYIERFWLKHAAGQAIKITISVRPAMK